MTATDRRPSRAAPGRGTTVAVPRALSRLANWPVAVRLVELIPPAAQPALQAAGPADPAELAGRVPGRAVYAGTAGSVLVALGGFGVGSLPGPAPGGWFGLDAVARSAALRGVSLALAVAGVLLLAGAWWRVWARLDGVSSRAVAVATTAWSVPLLLGPPMFSRDVYAYGAQGVVVARGFDPYRLGPIEGGGAFSAHVDPIWRGTPSPYGPAYLAPASWVVRLTGGSVVPTVLLLRLLAVLGVLLAGWALVRLARRHGVPAQRALWLGVANPLVLLHGVSGAHNDVLMVGFMLAGMAVAPTAAAARWRLLAAGGLIAVAVLVKAPAVAALPALVLSARGGRARLRAAALLGTGAVVTALAVQLVSGIGPGWLGTLGTSRKVLSLFSPTTGAGTVLGGVLRQLGLVSSTDTVRAPVLLVGTAVGVTAAGVLLLLTPRIGALRSTGLAMLAVVLLSPTVLPWYPLWGVLPLAACVGRRTAAGLAAACLVLTLATFPNGSSVVPAPLFGLPVVLAVAAGVLAARRAAPRPALQPGGR